MNYFSRPAILSLILLMLFSITVSGQETETTGEEQASEGPVEITLDNAEGTLGISHEMTVMAEAELNIGGQLYQISIPATVVIDTEQILAEASTIVNADHQVGAFVWELKEMEETDEFEAGFSSAEASGDDNKLVVLTFDMTNMADTTLSIWDAEVEIQAVDDLGKQYESSDRFCDDIDPGETASCTWIFDVPADVNMVDASISAMQTKKLSLSKETEE